MNANKQSRVCKECFVELSCHDGQVVIFVHRIMADLHKAGGKPPTYARVKHRFMETHPLGEHAPRLWEANKVANVAACVVHKGFTHCVRQRRSVTHSVPMYMSLVSRIRGRVVARQRRCLGT